MPPSFGTPHDSPVAATPFEPDSDQAVVWTPPGFLRRIIVCLGKVGGWLWLRRVYQYRKNDFEARVRFADDYRYVAESLMRRLQWDSILDIGCGNGFLLHAAWRHGKKVGGLDLSSDVHQVLPIELRPFVQVGDFAGAQGQWDLVCCTEVAEHVPPARSKELVQKLVSLSSKYIYFTAARWWQIGYGHINNRPAVDWLEFFHEAGCVIDQPATMAVRNDLRPIRRATWLTRNSLVFVRKSRTLGYGGAPHSRPAS
jgi:SAM-dependent methyltransferase